MSLLSEAQQLLGASDARDATSEDAVDGVVPDVVVEPRDADGVAATVEWASRCGYPLVTRGSGTKLGWSRRSPRVAVVVSTKRLNRILAHRFGDLTATVEAGARLADVNEALNTYHQWIPLDSPTSDSATIGGLVATNDSGPRRIRYGAPRDMIIGIDFVRGDGIRAKGGGIVVKNVAGYDLPRLLTGSFGSLGVIVGATFKLYPRPETSRTVTVDLSNHDPLAALSRAVLHSLLTPTAVELLFPPLRVLVRFESTASAADEQARAALAVVGEYGRRCEIAEGNAEVALWRSHAIHAWVGLGTLLKVSVLQKDVPAMLASIQTICERVPFAVTAGLGTGTLLCRIEGDVDSQQAAVAAVRRVLNDRAGHAVVIRTDSALKDQIDVYGPIGPALTVMRAVKQQLDPTGTLNPGRTPWG